MNQIPQQNMESEEFQRCFYFLGGELKATKVGATPKSDIVAWIKENI